MYTIVLFLILAASILLVLVVLAQNSKGGGLASNFSASNQVMGVRKTADFLEKATWTLAIALLVLSLVAVIAIPKADRQKAKSEIEGQVKEKAPEATTPAFPTTPQQDNKTQPATPQQPDKK
jgi:protein translocase, SecG subunit